MADSYKVGGLTLDINIGKDDSQSTLAALAKSLSSVASALKKIDDASIKNLQRLGTNIANLGKKMDNVDADKIAAKFNQIANSMKPLIQQISALEKHTNGIKDLNKLSSAISTTHAEHTSTAVVPYAPQTSEAEESFGNALVNASKNFSSNADAAHRARQATSAFGAAEEALVVSLYNAEKAAVKQRIQFLQIAIAASKNKTEVKSYKTELRSLQKQYEKLNAVTNPKKGFMQQVGQLFKRVTLWKGIKSILQGIVNSLKQGVSNFALLDSGANDTMSQLTSSITVITTSLGAIMMPLLETITPLVMSIAEAFAELANTVSAAMSTTGYYTKINTEYLKDYASTSNASTFAFDSFQTMSNTNSLSGLTSTEKVDETDNALSGLRDTLSALSNILVTIFNTIVDVIKALAPAFSTIVNLVGIILEPLSEIVTLVAELISTLADALSPILTELFTNVVTPVLNGIADALTLILDITNMIVALCKGDLPSAWEYLKDAFSSWLGEIKNSFAAFWNLLVDVAQGIINFFINTINNTLLAPINWIGKIFGQDWNLGINKVDFSSVKISTYAEGGVPDRGTLFYAGEAGAEIVASQRNGSTGVTNIEQFAQAMVSALNSSGTVGYLQAIANKNTSVYLDGAAVARSTSFKREANRIGLF